MSMLWLTHPRIKDLTGQRFGRLIVVSFDRIERKVTYWLCRCSCGKTKTFRGGDLKNGSSLSCGCLAYELTVIRQTTHGMRDSKIYGLWHRMVQRCTDPNCGDYAAYGLRGIKVCGRWLDFGNFYSDMGERPPGCSLDRIDNGGDYCKENCRWASGFDQANNRRKRSQNAAA